MNLPQNETAEAAATESESAEMTPAQLAEAKEYGQRALVCDLADKVLDVAFLAVMAFLVAVPLDAWLSEFIPSLTLRLAAIFAITTLAHMAVSFPLSFYAGYSLEHHYEMSHQTLGRWLGRYIKRNGLSLLFGLALVLGLYWIIWIVGDLWWLAAAGAFFVVTVLMGQLAPVLVVPLFYKVERLDHPELNDRMERLAAGTGLSIQGVYRLGLSEETSKANAMLAGLGSTRRVLMGDTLLDRFTPDEIEVIFAHEIGHHVFRHIRKMIFTGLIYSVIGFWVCDRVLMAWAEQHYGTLSAHDLPPSSLPLLMLVLTVFALVLEPVQNAVSRRYERQCDRYALERTGLREAYQSAFRKLARLNKDDPDPHPLEVFLFHSHPPISERLAIADEK
jgi:STE24 endopeptidase